MADDPQAVRLRNENSKLKQRFLDSERTCRKLGRERKKLTKEVKWAPKYDLDVGIDKTIHWWRKRLL